MMSVDAAELSSPAEDVDALDSLDAAELVLEPLSPPPQPAKVAATIASARRVLRIFFAIIHTSIKLVGRPPAAASKSASPSYPIGEKKYIIKRDIKYQIWDILIVSLKNHPCFFL